MAGSLKLTPASALHISRHMIVAHGLIPNTSIQSRPLLIYHTVFEPSSVTPAALEEHLNSVGAVVPQWRCTMYPTLHYHSPTQEVLAVSRGAARLCFGGEGNAAKVEPAVRKGDVIIVPAGVAHRLMEDQNEGGESFEVVGRYPPGCNWDMCYGNAGEQDVAERIAILCMAIAVPFSRTESSNPCATLDALTNVKLSVLGKQSGDDPEV